MKNYRDNYYIVSYVRKARKACGYSQTQLAELCGTTQNTISNIEKGVYLPSIFLALLIADACMCSIEDLYYIRPKTCSAAINENIFC